MKRLNPKILCAVLCVISVIACILGYVVHYRYADNRIVITNTYVCYITRTGECYHAPSCRYADTSNDEMKTTVYEAKANGYRSCSFCRDRVEKGCKNETRICVHDPSVKYPSVGKYLCVGATFCVCIIVIFKQRAGVEPA